MTLVIYFLERNSGSYSSRSTLRTRIVAWLKYECYSDTSWLKRDNDIDVFTDAVMRMGGVCVGE